MITGREEERDLLEKAHSATDAMEVDQERSDKEEEEEDPFDGMVAADVMWNTLTRMERVEQVLKGKTSLAEARTRCREHLIMILLGVRELLRRQRREKKEVKNL